MELEFEIEIGGKKLREKAKSIQEILEKANKECE